ncbi:MAG TPA: biopolymer transporter ExbD [Myxococcota bacterium]|nr:biopolymer transporter ExbD [Myxococcota bacterium]HQK51352.1 biopolymer transporter ExbD [Myxococcota bacterium]
MAGTTSDSDEELISSINITPLVDIFLVLLIIFMVTANLFLEQERRLREIALSLPTAASGAPPAPEAAPLTVILDREGRTYLDGSPASLEAIQEAIGRRREATGRPPQAVLSADRDLPYGRVARVIDFLKLQGIADLAINVEELQITDQGAVPAVNEPARP